MPQTGRYLNGATIMTTPTPRSLEVARDAGFNGIEARAERLVGEADELAATARVARPGEILSLNGVRIGLQVDGSLDRDRLEADLAPRLEICRAIRATYLLAVPPRIPGMVQARALPGIRAGLALALDRAAEAGIGLAFEFLGFFDCPIGDAAAAAEAVRDLPGVGLVLDSCHWHASGGGSLDAFPVERLAMVHLNDAPPKPPREIEDADRVLPGLGVIRLGELVPTLRERGYDGPWSLETFNPSYWEEDPLAVARRGTTALDLLLSPAG
jgi:2-keto-myo-inositol isomerase